jgi:hypothetical protein
MDQKLSVSFTPEFMTKSDRCLFLSIDDIVAILEEYDKESCEGQKTEQLPIEENGIPKRPKRIAGRTKKNETNNGNLKKPKRKKPGPKGRSEEEKEADNLILRDWKQASQAKVKRKEFVKDWTLENGIPTKRRDLKDPAMTVSDLERIQGRVKKDKDRSQ